MTKIRCVRLTISWTLGPVQVSMVVKIIAAGSVDEVMKVKDSITGQYLSGRKFIALPEERRKPGKKLH